MSPDLLEEILVETRPAPDPVWAAELDERFARGFGKEPRPSRLARWRPMLLPSLGMAGTVALIAVVAVSLPGGDADEQASSAGGGSVAMDSAVTRESAPEPAAAGRSADSAAGGGAVPGAERRVERFASLTISADPGDVAAVGDQVLRVTDRLGGYVATSSVQDSEDGGGGSFELKVPVGRLDRAMAELSELGHVTDRSQSTTDITGQFNQARAQVQEARAERESLLRQLAAADTVNETTSIRARLRIVANELSAARQGQRQVGRRAAYATVNVALVADGDRDPDQGGAWTPGDALGDAGRVLEVAAGVAIVAAAVAVPLLLLGLLAWALVRITVRRRREAALDGAV